MYCTKNYIGGRRTGLTFALSIIIGGITGGVVDTYHPGIISKFKSVLSDAIHVAHQEYLKRYHS